MIDNLLAKAKVITELGAFGILSVIVLATLSFIGFHMYPQINKIEAVEATVNQIAVDAAAHRIEQWNWDQEQYRVMVIQCRATRELAKRDPDMCGPEATSPPSRTTTPPPRHEPPAPTQPTIEPQRPLRGPPPVQQHPFQPHPIQGPQAP